MWNYHQEHIQPDFNIWAMIIHSSHIKSVLHMNSSQILYILEMIAQYKHVIDSTYVLYFPIREYMYKTFILIYMILCQKGQSQSACTLSCFGETNVWYTLYTSARNRLNHMPITFWLCLQCVLQWHAEYIMNIDLNMFCLCSGMLIQICHPNTLWSYPRFH